jgi:hypothetical protein
MERGINHKPIFQVGPVREEENKKADKKEPALKWTSSTILYYHGLKAIALPSYYFFTRPLSSFPG